MLMTVIGYKPDLKTRHHERHARRWQLPELFRQFAPYDFVLKLWKIVEIKTLSKTVFLKLKNCEKKSNFSKLS